MRISNINNLILDMIRIDHGSEALNKVEDITRLWACKPCNRYTPLFNGRTGEIRTRDQRIKSPLLYRLSYRPIFVVLQKK